MTEAEQEELVAELAEEFLARLRSGEIITAESFIAEHPECADELKELKQLLKSKKKKK